MTKVNLNDVTTFQNDTTAALIVNGNSAVIETAFDNTLSRDGTSPNQMGANLDMNSNRVLNLPLPNSGSEPLRLQDAATLNGGGTITVPSFSAGTNISITGTGPTVLATIANPTFATSVTTPQVKNSAGIVNIPVSGTVTIPAATDTLVGRTTTDTLTNKTLTSPVISTISNTGTLTLPTTTDTLIGRATTDTLTNKTFNSAGSGNVMQISGVTVSRGQYPGESTTGSATAGNIGEFVSSTVPTGSSVSLTNAVTSNVTSISLTAGDWDVWGQVAFTAAGTTSVTILIGSITTSSGSNGVVGASNSSIATWSQPAAVPGAAFDPTYTLAIPPTRLSLTTTTTVFLTADTNFTVSTLKAYGFIAARRAR